MAQKRINKEKELKKEIQSWKETCYIVSDKNAMKSIRQSLKQIAQGKGIPLAQL